MADVSKTDLLADTLHQFASPPCFMHELDGAFLGANHGQTQQEIDVTRWRNAERERLADLCKSLPCQYQKEASRNVSASVELLIGEMQKGPVCFFRPIDGQINLVPLMEKISTVQTGAALPRKTNDHQAFSCRNSIPEGSLFVDGRESPAYRDDGNFHPKVLIVPVVAFDDDRFFIEGSSSVCRKFIEESDSRPYLIGVGYNFQNIKTVYPQFHDVKLDVIVTETGPVSWG